jgi:hypothetical protein
MRVAVVLVLTAVPQMLIQVKVVQVVAEVTLLDLQVVMQDKVTLAVVEVLTALVVVEALALQEVVALVHLAVLV